MEDYEYACILVPMGGFLLLLLLSGLDGYDHMADDNPGSGITPGHSPPAWAPLQRENRDSYSYSQKLIAFVRLAVVLGVAGLPILFGIYVLLRNLW